MKTVRRDLYDSECGDFTVRSEHGFSDLEVAKLTEFVRTWPHKHAQATQYSRPCPRLGVLDSSDKAAIRLLAQKWFPEEWFDVFAKALQDEIPAASVLEIGTDFVPPYRDDHAFIRVATKAVVFEDGASVTVGLFDIAKYPVSIAQFHEFTAKTGYRTVAERRDSEDTFRDNCFVTDIPAGKRGSLPALCVCYLDAFAYCEWAGARLPNEAEWLAAAVISEAVCEDEQLYERRAALRNDPRALVTMDQDELTATKTADGRVVVRCRPYLVRSKADLAPPAGVRLVSPTRYDTQTTFRVCRQETTHR